MPATEAIDYGTQGDAVLVGEHEPVPTPEPPRERAEGGALGALKAPRFARFFGGLIFSLTGVWIRITAMGYLVYELTEDEFKLGLISFAQAAPVLITGTIAGSILDRMDRTRIMLVVQVVNVLAMALVAFLVATDRVEFWHLVIIAVVIGSASGFDWPARMSIVPSLVARSRLQSAVALNSAAFNASRIIGPSIGGWLIGAVGLAMCFGFTAAAFVPFMLVLLTLGSTATARPAGEHQQSGFAALKEGYRYIWRTPRIRGLLSVDIIPLALGISYFTMAPAIARDVLDLGSRGLGILLAANGIGSLSGTIAVAMLAGVRNRGRIVVLGVGAFAICLIAFAMSSSVVLSTMLIMVLGLCTAIYSTFNDTLIQLTVDDAYRGRVLSVYSMMWGLTPIGGLQVGLLSRSIGVQQALAINGLLILLYMVFLWYRTPVRHID
ncbi:MAG TPA: MFS transporter [Thermomicrobiales bacterium]|nr:MFS transporter [Thermomicrobiales bacterium]